MTEASDDAGYYKLTMHRLLYGQAFPMSEAAQKDDFVLPIGKAKIERPGKDLTIVSLSRCVGLSLNAAAELKEKYGVDAEVINLRSIRPLDGEAIALEALGTPQIRRAASCASSLDSPCSVSPQKSWPWPWSMALTT